MCGNSILENRRQLYVITVLFSLFFLAISTPWDFGFTFFADSLAAWYVHYILGAILCIYVMWAFVRALVMLLTHERNHIMGCHG